MEPLWDLQIPRSTADTIVIRPTGAMFVTGISESYDEECYDKNVLGDYLEEKDFRYCIE